MTRATLLALALLTTVSACGRGPSSGLNPLRWFGGSQSAGPTDLTPPGGYARQDDARQPIPRILSARWQPTTEGRLLVVTGIGPTKGWWDAALLTETPMPAGRVRADADGVLRLRFVASPPPPEEPEARMPARPEVDTITVAMPLSNDALRGIERVAIQGGGNAVTLGR